MGLLTFVVKASVKSTIAAPFDRVQLQLQSQHADPRIRDGTVRRCNSASDCVSHFYHEGGILSFWRGHTLSLLGTLFPKILSYWLKPSFNDYARSVLTLMPETCATYPRIINSICNFLFKAPLELLSFQFTGAQKLVSLGMDDGRGSLDEVLRCTEKSFSVVGMLSCAAWFGFSVASVVLYRAAQVSIFGRLYAVNPWRDDKKFKGKLSAFLMAQIAINLAAAVTYPIETVNNVICMQLDGEEEEGTLASFAHHNIRTFKEMGVQAFWGGFAVKQVSGIGIAVLMTVWDSLEKEDAS